MTPTIPATLNTPQPPNSAAAPSKGTKSTGGQAKHVSARKGNDRRTVHERQHHVDPAWSAALHAAIGQQNEVRPAHVAATNRPAVSRCGPKGVAAVSVVQTTSKRVSSTQGHGAGKGSSVPDPAHDTALSKAIAPRGKSLPETTNMQKVAQAPGQNDQKQLTSGGQASSTQSPTEFAHEQAPLATSLPDIKTAHTLEAKAKQHPATTETGRSEPTQSVLGSSKPQPTTAQPVIAQAAPVEEQSPADTTRTRTRFGGQHQAANPVSMSSPQDGHALAGTQPVITAGNAHTIAATPASHLFAPASSQTLNPVSLEHLSAQIHLLHQTGGGQAEIRLDPPSLGIVQIQLTLQQNQAQVSFHAAQTATAQMLQASLPQLTQAMQQQGITLTHTQVHTPSDGGGVGSNTGGAGQQPGQQSGRQQPENAPVTVSFKGPGNVALASDPDNGVRAYA